ncbi:MAG: T9SS type A sorting domain-containing protein [Bacteroidia bacterium]|nr:T9SS type A sorting domain-containing protein [Bacteroidia bacterium]
MPNLYSILICLFLGLGAHAQPYETNPDFNRTRNWHFGHGVGLRFDPDTIYQVPTSIHTDEAAAVHTDQDGNLLLYSNGEKIWNANHEVIHNGNLALGHNSSGMGSVFVFHEDNPDSIYLFNTFWNISTTKEFSVNLIVRDADTFRIVYKDSVLMYNVCEPIAVVKANNGKDIWIVVHEFGVNNIYAYLLTSDGLVFCPIQSKSKITPTGSPNAAAFDMVFSPNGQYMIRTVTNLPPPIINQVVEIYEYDNSNGYFRFVYSLDNFNRPFTGLGFSKDNSKILLVERDSGLNIFEFNPTDSITTVASKKKINTSGSKFQVQNLTYGNDFVWTINESVYLAVINEDLIKDSIELSSGIAKFDFPNFNKSYFYTPSINFSYEMNCVSNTIQFHGQDTFSATSHDWLFTKQGVSMTASSKNPLIEFEDTGTYQVRYIASNGVRSDTMTKEVVILPKVALNFLGSDTGWCASSNASVTLHAPSGMHCYQWNTGATSDEITADTAGVYIAKITTPNFCVLYDTLIISIDTLPHTEADFLGDNLHWCENSDSSVILKAPDGFASYQWSTGDTTQEIEADTAGKYWVRAATVNGCFIADTLVISLDTLPDIATGFLGNNISWCENLDTSAMLKAPDNMLSYLWNTNDTIQAIEVSSAGVYWATVTAPNLCVFSDTVTVSTDTLPNIEADFLGADKNRCKNLDTSVILKAPADMLSYLWSTNETTQEIEADSEGMYWVRVTAHNLCVLSDTVTITLDTVPNIPIIYKDNDTLKTNAIADYYQWYRYELPIGSNQNYLLVSDTGVYRLLITNVFGCSAFSDTLHIPDTATNNVKTIEFNNIKVFPNPFNGSIEIEDLNENISKVSIYSSIGQKILEYAPNQVHSFISTNTWACGVYFISIELTNGQTKQFKLIKQT